MPPVALTCPLWWVARWATRILTSLAVVAALAVGSGASPASAAPPASAVSSGSSSSGWVAPAGAAELATPVVVDHTASPISLDAPPAAPAVEAAVRAEAGASAVGTGPRRSPRTADPATRASRAPPRL
ncbi:hypothetical protein [Micromonospora coriariae]|uniref:hypothetical protein n=1 Tax=Micromonospora coriariae TaxID=285665 RepID=UPI000B5B0054|nr:hypothetical protein [Micromonospora coriariae]